MQVKLCNFVITMCVRVWVCVCVLSDGYVYISMYRCMYVYKRIYVYVCMIVSLYPYMYVYVGVHVCVGVLGSVFSIYL